ncbi:sperm-tail PG-rich repeat-containing protein 2-like isoform X2 [Acanthaster planci]|uniref:Sperm-tail PG-rich repeat-containing protein 2-like isoform X2 n=1 Tax=Acanthaster planci TaxID=133434 RepID=A0A8B7XJT4_ACAPL|nr:sperm-tail PG-rich repeat-containing protein 2-like isoform X2 [Acanthaster planci]
MTSTTNLNDHEIKINRGWLLYQIHDLRKMETINELFPRTKDGRQQPDEEGGDENAEQIDGVFIQRTAMGEYLVPKDGKPLTQLAIPLPGPADYEPKIDLTARTRPQFSIVGRTKQVKAPPIPGPADYNTSGELNWKGKKKTLKEKGQTCPHGTKPSHHLTCSPGPAGYRVTYKDTGKDAPKISAASRHLDGVNVGHPNCLVQPVDTHGVQTPSSSYYHPESHALNDRIHKSFGTSRKTCNKTLGPGPAGYTIQEGQQGAAYSLSKRLPAKWQQVTDYPAPNVYDVGTTIGTGVAMAIRSRQPLEQKNWVPSPNTYTLRDPLRRSDAPVATVTYRPFSPTLKTWPSPAHYKPTDNTLPTSPRFSCRKFCKPCFPDILKYPAHAPDTTPGPGTYHSPRRFTDNDYPAFSMGSRPRSKTNDVPGANHYDIRVSHRPDGKKAPEFSMAKRCHPPHKNENPGPTAYNPPLDTNDGPKYSMIKRWNGLRSMNQKTMSRFHGAAENQPNRLLTPTA